MSDEIIVIDPPSGWKYGFPKEVPESKVKSTNMKDLLIELGYPESEINLMGMHLHVRYWKKNERE